MRCILGLVKRRRWLIVAGVLVLALVGGTVLLAAEPNGAEEFVPEWIRTVRPKHRRVSIIDEAPFGTQTFQITVWRIPGTFRKVKERLKSELTTGWSAWNTPMGGTSWAQSPASITIRDLGEVTEVEAISSHETTWPERAHRWIQRVISAQSWRH